jgi:deoxycytidine triphosphate deaminase
MLNDLEISQRAYEDQLIEPFQSEGLLHCRYNLRAARVFSAETGAEQVIGEHLPDGSTRRVWSISPTETLVIMTVERVKIPWDLVGQYGQLFRLAQQGLILMNTSIVEPGYDGPLSCVVVNLSKANITIAPESEIAKLTFERLSAAPGVQKPQQLTDKFYVSALAAAAVKLPKSFMGIEQVSQEVSDKVNADVKKSITFGGVILIFLLLLATLQPWISGLIFNRYPISTSDAAQIKAEMDDVTTRLNAADATLNSAKDVGALQQQVKRLSQEIQVLQTNQRKR